MVVAPAVGDVAGVGQGHSTGQGDGGQQVERVDNVVDCHVNTECEEHDAGHDEQMQVAVGVAGQPCPLFGGGGQQSCLGSVGEAEIGPPELAGSMSNARTTAASTPGWLRSPSAPVPTWTMVSPRAMMMIDPCRSTK